MKRKEQESQQIGFEGLEWRKNLIASHTDDTIHLIESRGGGVTDMLFHYTDDEIEWVDLHVGQDDRLTFFGDPGQTLYGYFIDCRKDSPTLHRRIDLTFNPDPCRHLFIQRGIAYRITNKRNITVRAENLWFVAEENPDYDITNDNINFRPDDDPKNFPVVTVNDQPVPDEALQFVLAQQQEALVSDQFRAPAARVVAGGSTARIELARTT